MRITSIGNVGIGTTTPNTSLTVRNGLTSGNDRTTSLANAIGDPSFELITTKGATSNNPGDVMTQIGQAYGTANPVSEGIQFIRGLAGFDGAMTFLTATTERVRITTNGYVGIGTSSPSFILDVAGRAQIRSGGISSGIWLMNQANTSDNAFIGNADDTHVGFYGNTGAGWGLAMNTTNGNVGIGTLTPGYKLTINNGTTNGAIQIQDGTQAAGYVLTSDANGVGTWQKTQVFATYSALGAGINIPYNTGTYSSTGTTITLPPGKYSVSVAMLLTSGAGTYAPNNSALWVRSTFGDFSTSTGATADIVGSPLASGCLVGPSKFAMLTGSIIINNTSGATKTYYYLAGATDYIGTTATISNFGGSAWAEDNIVAIRIQ